MLIVTFSRSHLTRVYSSVQDTRNRNLIQIPINCIAKYNTLQSHCLFPLVVRVVAKWLHLPRAHTDVMTRTQELAAGDPLHCSHGGQGVGT